MQRCAGAFMNPSTSLPSLGTSTAISHYSYSWDTRGGITTPQKHHNNAAKQHAKLYHMVSFVPNCDGCSWKDVASSGQSSRETQHFLTSAAGLNFSLKKRSSKPASTNVYLA